MNCNASVPQLAIAAVTSAHIAARVNGVNGSSAINGRVSCNHVYFGPEVSQSGSGF